MSDHLFRNAETSGVYYLPPPRLASIKMTAEKERLALLTAEIAPHANKDKALAQIGTGLSFPIWYGANFDALFDCLTDADWHPAKGHVIVIKGVAELRATDPDDFATLIEVFQAAAETRREAASPFWLLIDTPARGVAALPEA